MSRGLFFGPNAGIRRTLKEPDHLVHISVQEIEFLTQIGFHCAHLPSHTNSVFNAKASKRAGLWRRLCIRLRREESRKLPMRGELRPEWEIDNVSCSHCCTSDVHFGQGRVGVTSTGASRYSLLLFGSLPCLSVDTLTPIPRFLVFLDHCKILFGPTFRKPTANDARNWRGYLLPVNPTPERLRVNL